MKENSKHINVLVCAAVCLLVIVCAVFLRRNDYGVEENHTSSADKLPNIRSTAHETVEDSFTEPLSYTLRLEADTLSFYLNSESGTILLETAPINSKIFPKNDIDALCAGVTVSTLEEGIGIIEDFTS